jgi:hypothetical protein
MLEKLHRQERKNTGTNSIADLGKLMIHCHAEV